MTTDRALARAQVAERGLTAAAAEVVVRGALSGMSPTIVARATHQLRRLFSDGPWSAEDDAALSAAVGPGVGWYEEELDPELTLGFGWRAGSFVSRPTQSSGAILLRLRTAMPRSIGFSARTPRTVPCGR